MVAAFFKFFQLSEDRKHLTQLQPETFAFKFLRRAYCVGAQVFLLARNNWPQLFEGRITLSFG